MVVGKGATINAKQPISMHAHQRMQQRCIREARLDYVLTYGKVYDRAGATWYVLRRKDIPREDRSNDQILKMVGVVVCMESGVVTTVYHNERPGHHIRQKPKHDARSRHSFSASEAA